MSEHLQLHMSDNVASNFVIRILPKIVTDLI